MLSLGLAPGVLLFSVEKRGKMKRFSTCGEVVQTGSSPIQLTED